MTSLRSRLADIRALQGTTDRVRIPGDFHSCPRSLRSAMRAMMNPRLAEWSIPPEYERSAFWTNNAQGIATDGHYWYVSTYDPGDFVGITKLSANLKDIVELAKLPWNVSNHIGDIDLHKGRIYAGVEDRRVAIFDTTPMYLGIHSLPAAGVENGLVPWVAVNPVNGWLYTSAGGDGPVNTVHAYDPGDGFAYRGPLHLEPPSIRGLQGGCFSNGKLYVTCDKWASEEATQDVRAYSALNGAFLGRRYVPYDPDAWPGAAEEMQGITIAPFLLDGETIRVHVMVLDNDASTDELYMRHFHVPDPKAV